MFHGFSFFRSAIFFWSSASSFLAASTLAFANVGAGGPTAQVSPPTAFDTFLCAGCVEGNGEWFVPTNNARDIYFGTIWSTNSDFVGLLIPYRSE